MRSALIVAVAALALSTPSQAQPEAEQISYSGAYTCWYLADRFYSRFSADPVAAEAVGPAVVAAADQIATRAQAEMEPARVRWNYDTLAVTNVQTSVQQELAEASDDTLMQTLDACAALLGVTVE